MKVLLSSVAKPIGSRNGDGSAVGYELLHAQVTRAQGVFSPRAVHLQYGIEYIAANLRTETVTLHYPSERDFVRELRKGGFSHVGIAFNLSTSHRMRHMCRLVRRHAPTATIVLGGYGTILPDEELLSHGDVVCREEGVAFMRRLLGEPEGPKPYDHPLIVSTLKVLGLPVSKTGLIFAGLGCPNGCDFCCTSHFFKRKHIRLLPTGADLFRVIRAYKELDPAIEFTVLDEDFLLNRKRAMELRELLLQHELHADMFAFASAKALSQYTSQELVELGIGGVWIGFEGTRAGYAKQDGRPLAELIPELKRHGILVLASMIVGLDYQTPAVVKAELEQLMQLEPTLAQFLIYGPVPGTPLGARTDREGTWLDPFRGDQELRWRRSDGFSSMVRHPHMGPREIETLQRYCFAEDYRRLGPSILRTAEVWQTGWENLRHRSEPGLQRRAAFLRDRLQPVSSLTPVARLLAPSRTVRHRLRRLESGLRDSVSLPRRALNVAVAAAALPAAGWTAVRGAIGLGEHPPTTRRHRKDVDPYPRACLGSVRPSAEEATEPRLDAIPVTAS